MNETKQITIELTRVLGRSFRKRSSEADKNRRFVYENYDDLKQHGYFSLLIPEELGGSGQSFEEVCNHIRVIGSYCPSTALAFAMHSHLIATTVWKYKKEQGGQELLKKVAEKQLVLISTGARDWLESNGRMDKVDGGYNFSGIKYFASQSAVGDLVVTSAPFLDKKLDWQVLHFAVPMNSEGVSLHDDWDTLGMRGTGSNTIEFEDVFIPDEAITLSRSQGQFHPFWNVVLTVAMPLIMSAYVGLGERAFDIVVRKSRQNFRPKSHLPYQVGEAYNLLTSARIQYEDMIRIADDLNFGTSDSNSTEILTRKTNVTNSLINLLSKSMETVGGSAFYRKNELEKLFRDVQASKYHPLNEWDQQYLIGTRILEEDTIESKS